MCQPHYQQEWRRKRKTEDPSYLETLARQERERRARDPEAARAKGRAWYQANRERALEQAARSRAKHRETSNARRRARHVYDPRKWRKNLKSNYGISPTEYDTLYDAQDGCCAICGEPERITRNGRQFRLGVDHCHTTGEVRALLCRVCNARLGVLEDEVFCAMAAAYLARHQTSRIV